MYKITAKKVFLFYIFLDAEENAEKQPSQSAAGKFIISNICKLYGYCQTDPQSSDIIMQC